MSSPLKTIYLKRGHEIEENYPAKSLVQGIQSGDLIANHQISDDGKNWVELGKHKQLAKYFKSLNTDIHTEPEVNISDLQNENTQAVKEKILIIEDEPPLYKLLAYTLKKEGYQITWAKDGEEALKCIENEKPDLIVTDIMIPYINGLQVLEHTKKNPETSDIPFVILSSKALEQDIITGLKMGGADYITKPFNPEEVLLRVQMILERTKNT